MSKLDARCRGCEYFFLGWDFDGRLSLCEYILKVGVPRPCPAGRECTAYAPRVARERTEACKMSISRLIRVDRRGA